MYVKWKNDSGSFTKYHRISRSDSGMVLDVATGLMAAHIPGEPLLTQCGLPIPAEHVGAEGLPIQEFNGGLCESCIQANGF